MAPNLTVGDIVSQFLTAHDLSLATTKWYAAFLTPLIEKCGHLRCDQVTPSAITPWLSRYSAKSVNTKHAAARSWNRLAHWARNERLANLPRLRKPPQTPRTSCVTKQQYAEMVNAAPCRNIQSVIRFLWHTGCRPQELRIARWAWLDNDTLTIPACHAKTKRPRIILLNRAALSVVRAQPRITDEIFSFRSKPWSKDGLARAIRAVGASCGVAVCAYSFRHAFATRYLIRGVDIASLAAIMGTSSRMILHHYQHVTEARNIRSLIV